MRPSVVDTHAQSALPIPRGWLIVGAAAVSWLVIVATWFGASHLFALVFSGI